MQREFRQGIRNRLIKDVVWRKFAMDALKLIKATPPVIYGKHETGETFEVPFRDLFCQTFRSDLVTLEDELYVAVAWQKVLAGKLVYRILHVRETPRRDANTVGNQAILTDMVDYYRERAPETVPIVSAYFQGRGHGEDGIIDFSRPFVTGGKRTNFPLEVGYCMPDQMFFHLSQCRCVARFAYGSDKIVFFENLEKHKLVWESADEVDELVPVQ